MNSFLTTANQHELNAMLQQEKVKLEKQLKQTEHFGTNQSLGETTGELSTYDNHPADIGTEQFERGKDIALEEHAALRLDDVKAALERMQQGSYGICTTCEQPIPYERLQAIPTATLCLDHANNANPQGDTNKGDIGTRPVEESFLYPPFGKTDLDDQDQTGFDGEDAWQIVEQWGTSNTPAMAEEPDVNDYNGMYIESGEHDGYVESFEQFIATDLYGNNVSVLRNQEYDHYIKAGEGDRSLEPDTSPDKLDDDTNDNNIT